VLEIILSVNGEEIDRIRIVRIKGETGEECEYKITPSKLVIKHNTRDGARALAQKVLKELLAFGLKDCNKSKRKSPELKKILAELDKLH